MCAIAIACVNAQEPSSTSSGGVMSGWVAQLTKFLQQVWALIQPYLQGLKLQEVFSKMQSQLSDLRSSLPTSLPSLSSLPSLQSLQA